MPYNKTIAEEVLTLLQSHRSIRKFKDQSISQEDLTQIISSAQMSSTSSHVQAYSMIGITDAEIKKKLAEYAGGQRYVESCAHFFVFCADLHRLDVLCKEAGVDVTATLETTEKFMVATIDAALAAQNAAIAAESLGLGIVYIGGIRNNPQQVSEILKLPDKVYPVFGMCLGYPDQDPERKPRLPQSAVYFENEYPEFTQIHNDIKKYDQRVKKYYTERTGGRRQDTWSEMMVKTLQEPTRTHMKSFLKKRGFPLN